MNTNPFSFGNPVYEQDKFWGRSEEIRQVVNRLLSSAHESTSVVGERRIGKTSLLKYISNPLVAPQLGLDPDHYCLVYIDFQGLTDITPQRFWNRVLNKIERSICLPELSANLKGFNDRKTFDLFDLEDLFEEINSRGLTIVLLMDEFEYVTQNSNFGADFFGGLRALSIHQNLPLVTATRRELVDLCHSRELKGSPFFNIFANVILRTFRREVVLEMLDKYVPYSGYSFNAEEKDIVIRLGGSHPFFVQMAGYYLWEAKRKGLEGNAIFTQVKEEFSTQSDPHYSYFWQHCTDSEKITLLSIISLGRQKSFPKTLPKIENLVKMNPKASFDVPELVKKGFVQDEGQRSVFRIQPESFENWIVYEISAPPGEEESSSIVNAWLESGERENIKWAGEVLPKFKRKYWPLLSTILREMSFELAGAAAFQVLSKLLF